MFSATPIAGYVNQLHIQNMFKRNREKIERDQKCFFSGQRDMVKNVLLAWLGNSKVDCLQNELM